MSKQLKAICGTPDTPLRIGEFEIPCYVLENEKRVVIQSGMLKALGIAKGSAGKSEGDRLSKFVSQDRFNQFLSNELLKGIKPGRRFWNGNWQAG
jgi:hypothetical protein